VYSKSSYRPFNDEVSLVVPLFRLEGALDAIHELFKRERFGDVFDGTPPSAAAVGL
jgi:hypothetical protein